MNGTSFIRDIKKDLPSLYGIVLTNIQPIEQKLHIKFSENDIAYITMLLSNALKDDLFTLRIILVTTKDENTSVISVKKYQRVCPFLTQSPLCIMNKSIRLIRIRPLSQSFAAYR